MSLKQAQRIKSLRSVFGERYPDPVRVLSVGQDVSHRYGSVVEMLEYAILYSLTLSCDGALTQMTAAAADANGDTHHCQHPLR